MAKEKTLTWATRKKQFKQFESVRRSGMYNMFDPRARRLTNLSRSQWQFCMDNYDTLHEAAYPEEYAQNEEEE